MARKKKRKNKAGGTPAVPSASPFAVQLSFQEGGGVSDVGQCSQNAFSPFAVTPERKEREETLPQHPLAASAIVQHCARRSAQSATSVCNPSVLLPIPTLRALGVCSGALVLVVVCPGPKQVHKPHSLRALSSPLLPRLWFPAQVLAGPSLTGGTCSLNLLSAGENLQGQQVLIVPLDRDCKCAQPREESDQDRVVATCLQCGGIYLPVVSFRAVNLHITSKTATNANTIFRASSSLTAFLQTTLTGRVVCPGSAVRVLVGGAFCEVTVVSVEPNSLRSQPEAESVTVSVSVLVHNSRSPASLPLAVVFPPSLAGLGTVNSITRLNFITPSAPTEHTVPLDLDATPKEVGGLHSELRQLRRIVDLALLRPHLCTSFGLRPPRGVLLHGPPGTGKTLLVRTLAAEVQAALFVVNGPEVVGQRVGESEDRLRTVFAQAAATGRALLFLDEIDTICPRRSEIGDELQKRVVGTLLTLLDGYSEEKEEEARVLVLAATNRPDALDPALRRPGRFDRELEIGIPTELGRLDILKKQLAPVPHDVTTADLERLASNCHGYVGADLHGVCREAAGLALQRHLAEKNALLVHEADLKRAFTLVPPSTMRKALVRVPKVRWEDVGGQQTVKARLCEAVDWPLKHSAAFARLHIAPPKGILLYGPPGCSKTLLARALATECSRNFIAVKGPELFSKWVGESEKAVRLVFKQARAASPSVVFFDEIDSLAAHRGFQGQRVADRVLSQLLVEIDGVRALQDVFVLAATNRPDLVDPALLRPGRFDRVLYVAPPDHTSMPDVFEICLRGVSVAEDVNVHELARAAEGMSGAEVAAVCREAAVLTLEEECSVVHMRHLQRAMKQITPQITPAMLRFYEEYQEQNRLNSI